MVSPVQYSNNRQVYFRANDDLISSPGAFQQTNVPETPADEVIISSNEAEPKKKGGIAKTIFGVLGTAVVVAGALFGLTKWKGEKWLNPKAEKFVDKLKNWAVKPGEWLEKQGKALLKKCGIGKGAKATGEAGADAAASTERAVGEAGEAAKPEV